MQNKYNTYAKLMIIKTVSFVTEKTLQLFSITRLIELVRTFGCKLNYKWNYLTSASFLCIGHAKTQDILENISIQHCRQCSLLKCIGWRWVSSPYLCRNRRTSSGVCFRVYHWISGGGHFLGLDPLFLYTNGGPWFKCPDYRCRWTWFGRFNKNSFLLGVGGVPPQMIRTMKPPLLQ